MRKGDIIRRKSVRRYRGYLQMALEKELETYKSKLPELKDTMRSLIMNASSTLEGLPPNERIAMEAILLNSPGEKSSREIPRRIFMSAEKQKLLDAKASHATPAELAALVEEQDR